MNRETVYVKESKKRIENIKKKYNNMQMSDSTANKIISLEATNSMLKTAATVVGIITVIDFIVPDPVLGLDEVALASLTGLFKFASSIVDNKIDKLSRSEDASLKMSEITKLAEQIGNAASSVKASRTANK